jgi:D-alanyl-D-alanine carboxypeptidase
MVLFLLVLAVSGYAEAKPKFAAIAVDARTGKVLFARDADGIRHPASLTKVMTLYVLFEDLKAGRLKLTTPLRASKRAAGMAPTKLGVKPGSTITVDQAIRAMVTKSANDVAVMIAENLGGSESEFAERMTRTARSLGMSRTVFKNASGLPNPAQVTSARDMATLSLRIQRDFPEYYPYFRITAFTYKGQVIKTHNRLLGRYDGTDGIKTGFINASGFNLTTSVKRGQKRIVGVVMGAKSAASRNKYMMSMLDQALPQCKNGDIIVASVGGDTGVAGTAAADASATKLQKHISKGKTAGPDKVSKIAAATLTESPDEDAAEASEAIGDADKTALNSLLTEGSANPQPSQPGQQPQQSPVPGGNLPFAVKSAAAADPTATWHIQIGAYPTKTAAESKINLARETAAEDLADKQAFTLQIMKGKEIVYRARFSGFSEDSARSACKRLQKKGIECLTLSPQG